MKTLIYTITTYSIDCIQTTDKYYDINIIGTTDTILNCWRYVCGCTEQDNDLDNLHYYNNTHDYYVCSIYLLNPKLNGWQYSTEGRTKQKLTAR